MTTQQLINPTSFLGSTTLTLHNLLINSDLVVPDYQRDFSWGKTQVSALWDDLLATSERAFDSSGTPTASPLPHFVGPLVLQQFPQQPNRAREVMDGQQRLVTLSALVAVLREHALAGNTKDIHDWAASLASLLGQHTHGEFKSRIALARDNDHYVKLICECKSQAERNEYVASVPAKSHVLKNLDVALKLLHKSVGEHLADRTADERDAALVRLIRSVLDLTIFLQMEVHEQGVAYEVFEGLNARGLELQQADLLKNRLYQLAESQGSSQAVRKLWERTIAAIEGQETITLTEYLYFHHLVRIGNAKQKTLFRFLDEYLAPANKQVAVKAEGYAKELAQIAENLQTLLDSGSTLSAQTVRDVEVLRDSLSNKYALVLLIAGAHKHSPGSTELAEICRLAHHYAFRRFSVEGESLGKYSGEVVEIARGYAADTNTRPDPASIAKEMRLRSKDSIFQERFKHYSVGTNKMGFYALEMIENYLAKGSGTHVYGQSPTQHLEHIMPKNPGDSWGAQASDPLYPEYVGRLGNLLVLEAEINQSVKNRDYQHKKSNSSAKDYAHSSMALPRDLDKWEVHGDWTVQSISARQDYLAAKYALLVWRL